MSKGLEALERLQSYALNDEEYLFNDNDNEYLIIKKELKDYYEIKEIAEHYNFEDLGNEVHKIDTDRKWQLKFDAGIFSIQKDYRKARVLDILKRISYYDIHYLDYLLSENKITREEFNMMKEVLLHE